MQLIQDAPYNSTDYLIIMIKTVFFEFAMNINYRQGYITA